MEKTRAVVFDLFDTLLHDIKFDINMGLSYIYENILLSTTNKDEFLDYAYKYWKVLYDKRIKDNFELAFEDELLDFKNKYGFKVNYPLEEILYNCALKVNDTELFDDTISILNRLNLLEIPVYLLSNSIFKKNVMKRFINQYDLEKYFANMYFSADYNVRKPHKDLFKIVFDDIKKYDANIEMRQVLFIGDNFETDILGAENFGFTPVFINRRHDADSNNKSFIEIKSLDELLEVINEKDKSELILNLDNLHTTDLGMQRIKRNLCLDADDVVVWCREKIENPDSSIIRRGKNWYIYVDDCKLTVNAYSYTIITAHKLKSIQ